VSRPKKCVGQRLLRHSTSSQRQSGEAKCSLGLKKALFLSERQKRRRTSRRCALFARASRRSSSGGRSRGSATSTSGRQGTSVVKIPLVSRGKEHHHSRGAGAHERGASVAVGRRTIARARRRGTSCASAWSSDRCIPRFARIGDLIESRFYRVFAYSRCRGAAELCLRSRGPTLAQRAREARHLAALVANRSSQGTTECTRRSTTLPRERREEPFSYPCLPLRRRAAPHSARVESASVGDGPPSGGSKKRAGSRITGF
jgi:hypothetical protein